MPNTRSTKEDFVNSLQQVQQTPQRWLGALKELMNWVSIQGLCPGMQDNDGHPAGGYLCKGWRLATSSNHWAGGGGWPRGGSSSTSVASLYHDCNKARNDSSDTPYGAALLLHCIDVPALSTSVLESPWSTTFQGSRPAHATSLGLQVASSPSLSCISLFKALLLGLEQGGQRWVHATLPHAVPRPATLCLLLLGSATSALMQP